MTDKAIRPLRRRLLEDMAIRRLSPKTQLHYIRHVKRFADFLGRSASHVHAVLIMEIKQSGAQPSAKGPAGFVKLNNRSGKRGGSDVGYPYNSSPGYNPSLCPKRKIDKACRDDGCELNTADGHIEAIKRWRDVYNSVR